MSDLSRESETGRRQPPHLTCHHCGGTARPVTLLDSRLGRNIRILRCLSCERTSWPDEE